LTKIEEYVARCAMNKLKRSTFSKKIERKVEKIQHLLNQVFTEMGEEILLMPDYLKNNFENMKKFFSTIHFNEFYSLLMQMDEEKVKQKERLSQEDIKNIKQLLTEYHTPKKKICEKYKISFKKLQHYLTLVDATKNEGNDN